MFLYKAVKCVLMSVHPEDLENKISKLLPEPYHTVRDVSRISFISYSFSLGHMKLHYNRPQTIMPLRLGTYNELAKLIKFAKLILAMSSMYNVALCLQPQN